MTKKKKTTKKEDPVVDDTILSVDPTKVLNNLTIAAGYVNMLQQTLLYVLSTVEEGSHITNSFAKLEAINKVQDKTLKNTVTDKEIPTNDLVINSIDNSPITPLDISIYTLTTLSRYLKVEAEKQNAVVKYKGLKKEDYRKGMEALLNNNIDDYKKEIEKLAEKIVLA